MIELREIDPSWMHAIARTRSAPEPIRSSAGPSSGGDRICQPAGRSRWAWGVLALFFAMNLLDSVDQWLLAAVLRTDQR